MITHMETEAFFFLVTGHEVLSHGHGLRGAFNKSLWQKSRGWGGGGAKQYSFSVKLIGNPMPQVKILTRKKVKSSKNERLTFRS